jgi:endonuclease YncB( thermonuclease family)
MRKHGIGKVRHVTASRYWRAVLCAALVSWLAGAAPAGLEGYVSRIVDGDTVVVQLQSGSIRVRLAEIDAPEMNQPYGQQSAAALSDLVLHRTVFIEPISQDRYERMVARLYVGKLEVNAEMIRSGDAWAYDPYILRQDLCALEADARTRKNGLWSLAKDQRQPPWRWRHPTARVKLVCARRE